jgi:hypothetical protein
MKPGLVKRIKKQIKNLGGPMSSFAYDLNKYYERIKNLMR